MLGIRTHGCKMVGVDETTELRWPPNQIIFFLKMGQPRPLLRWFSVFSNKHYKFLQKIFVKKCPSSVQCRDSNSWSLERESPPITTRPGLPPYRNFIISARQRNHPLRNLQTGASSVNESLGMHVAYKTRNLSLLKSVTPAAKIWWEKVFSVGKSWKINILLFLKHDMWYITRDSKASLYILSHEYKHVTRFLKTHSTTTI